MLKSMPTRTLGRTKLADDIRRSAASWITGERSVVSDGRSTDVKRAAREKCGSSQRKCKPKLLMWPYRWSISDVALLILWLALPAPFASKYRSWYSAYRRVER